MKEFGRHIPLIVGLFLIFWGIRKVLVLAAPQLTRVHPVLGQGAVALSQ